MGRASESCRTSMDNFGPSLHSQDRVVTGHAATAVADHDGEETAVIGRDRRWSGVGSLSGSRDVDAVFPPLIVQRRRADRGYPKPGCLPHTDCRIARLFLDQGRYRGRTRSGCRRRCWRQSRCWSRCRRGRCLIVYGVSDVDHPVLVSDL